MQNQKSEGNNNVGEPIIMAAVREGQVFDSVIKRITQDYKRWGHVNDLTECKEPKLMLKTD